MINIEEFYNEIFDLRERKILDIRNGVADDENFDNYLHSLTQDRIKRTMTSRYICNIQDKLINLESSQRNIYLKMLSKTLEDRHIDLLGCIYERYYIHHKDKMFLLSDSINQNDNYILDLYIKELDHLLGDINNKSNVGLDGLRLNIHDLGVIVGIIEDVKEEILASKVGNRHIISGTYARLFHSIMGERIKLLYPDLDIFKRLYFNVGPDKYLDVTRIIKIENQFYKTLTSIIDTYNQQSNQSTKECDFKDEYKSIPFEDYLLCDDKEQIMKKIHSLLKNPKERKGKSLAILITALVDLNYLIIPSPRSSLYKAIDTKFGSIGATQGVDTYLRNIDRYSNEVSQMIQILRV